jgi:Right handed beta helix region
MTRAQRRPWMIAAVLAAAFATAGAGAPHAAPAAPTVNAAGCTRTVAAGGNIQSAVAATPNGGTLCLTAGATYYLSSSVRIDDRSYFTFDGKGATLKAKSYFSGWAPIVSAWGSSHLTIRNLNIIGSHPSPGKYMGAGQEFQAGVALYAVQTAMVEKVSVKNNLGDGFYIGYGFAVPSRNIVVRDSKVATNGRQGVAITHAKNVIIARVSFYSIAYVAIDLEPDRASPAHYVDTVSIRDNTFGGKISYMVGGYGPGWMRNITVERNRVYAGTNHGIWSYFRPTSGFRASNILFRDNVGDQRFWEDPGWRGVVFFCRTDGAKVTGNHQPITAGMMPGVQAAGSTGVSVSGNTFNGQRKSFETAPTGTYACP